MTGRGQVRLGALRGSPLARRFAGYSLGSVVATITSEAAFVAAYAWGHTGTLGASACGFVGGAVPNYILNRRWAWRDRAGHDRRREATLYACVALLSFVTSAAVTHWAEGGARHLTGDHATRTALIALAYLAVSGVFFVAKFVAFDRLVFRRPGGAGQADDEADAPRARAARSTTS